MASAVALTIIAICAIIVTTLYTINCAYRFILLIVSLFSKDDDDDDE